VEQKVEGAEDQEKGLEDEQRVVINIGGKKKKYFQVDDSYKCKHSTHVGG